MDDLQAEHQREMEGLLDSVRQLSRELRLQMLIIDSFIPSHYQVSYFKTNCVGKCKVNYFLSLH